jgi:hypothetical protein
MLPNVSRVNKTTGGVMAKDKSPALAAQSLVNALQEQQATGMGAPVLRLKLRTLVAQSGYSVLTPTVRAKLVTALRSAGLHVAPELVDAAVGQDRFLAISRHPLQPDAFLFKKEAHLEDFVEASLGVDVLRNLTLYRGADGRPGRQFKVGRLCVDLLCRETLSPNKWGLVAIELKREEAPRGTLSQIMEYLESLQKIFPGRPLRGIIISSSEEAIDAKVLGEQHSLPFRVDWLRYRVTLSRVAATPQPKSAT